MRYCAAASRDTTAARRVLASSVSRDTSFLNTVSGGPSIDSKATVVAPKPAAPSPGGPAVEQPPARSPGYSSAAGPRGPEKTAGPPNPWASRPEINSACRSWQTRGRHALSVDQFNPFFGARFELGNRDVGLLAVGSAAFIFTLTLAQALIALRSYAAAALSWLAGAVGCVAGAMVAHDLFLRSELSFAIGAIFAAIAMLGCLLFRLRSDVPMDAIERLVEDIEHEPLEI